MITDWADADFVAHADAPIVAWPGAAGLAVLPARLHAVPAEDRWATAGRDEDEP